MGVCDSHGNPASVTTLELTAEWIAIDLAFKKPQPWGQSIRPAEAATGSFAPLDVAGRTE
jgi:hypothetical protein